MMAMLALALATPVSFIIPDPAATYDYICRIRTFDEQRIDFTARISGAEDHRVARVSGASAKLAYGDGLPVRSMDEAKEIAHVKLGSVDYAYIFDSGWPERIIATVLGLDFSNHYLTRLMGVGFCTKRNVQPEGRVQ